MKMLFKTPALEFTHINTKAFTGKNIKLLVARLDKIHPIISGNKLFKLHYFLEKALQSAHKTILTFGGAYSNHLLATAYACQVAGLKCIGAVRGEQSTDLSHTLKECLAYGMQLKFLSRTDYQKKGTETFIKSLDDGLGEYFVIPEGGYDPSGAKGASLIMEDALFHKATHICTAVGTATTLAGLMRKKNNDQIMIGVPVIKNMTDIQQRISFLNGHDQARDLVIFDNYHFGGYAKKTKELVDFMNDLYEKTYLPTDFVYTGKMMYAVIDKIKSGYFADGSIIACLHTGGLQGNASLPPGTLVF